MKNYLLASGILILGLGCMQETPKSPEPVVTAASFHDFTDRWSAFHVSQLVKNSQQLAAELNRQTNRPSQKEKANPRSVLLRSARFFGLPYLATSPAINTFAPHLPSSGSSLLGPISEEAARLRIWLADRKASASWFYFRLGVSPSKRTSPLYFDPIGDNPPSSREKELSKVVAQAEQAKADVTSGEIPSSNSKTPATFLFETRKLRFSDPSCIKCHPSKKLNDVAGTMVYVVRMPEVPVKGK